MGVTRDELHRLVDEVPQDELDNASVYLHRLAGDEESGAPARRTFRSLGAFSGPRGLAARSKDILREELGGAK